MDVTPDAVREGRFREALRGYNRDDVDEFLDRVAGGIAVLQERLREASERAERAEAQATEATELDDSLRRTLVLAQRTADLAIEEARREAGRLLEDAETQRQQALGELAAEREQLREELKKGIHDEVSALHETRERLQSDIAELSAYYERQRGWLRAVLAEQLRAVDEGAIDAGPPPAISDIDTSLLDRPRVHGEPVVVDDEEDVEEEATAKEAPSAAYEGGETSIDITDDSSVQAGVTSNGAPPSDSPDVEGASAFLSELQRAMDSTGTNDGFEEDDVLPPPDERARAFFDEEDEVAARRFGSLRRRRRRP